MASLASLDRAGSMSSLNSWQDAIGVPSDRYSTRKRKQVKYYESEDEDLFYDSEDGPQVKVSANYDCS
jgi:hypothetical protein